MTESAGATPGFTERGSGPPVLLLHDPTTAVSDWEQLVELMEPWMRVLVRELPGDATAIAPEAEAIAAEAASIGLLGDERFAVIGHGIGGAVAQYLAVDPRTGQALKTLVLIDSVALTPELEGVGPALAGLEYLPVFMVWGEDDDVVPVATAERLAEMIPFSTLAVIPEAGHRLPAEDPFTTFPLVYQFLRLRFLEKGHGHDEPDGPGGPVKIEILTERPDPPR